MARGFLATSAAGQPQIPPLRCASVGMTAVGRRGGRVRGKCKAALARGILFVAANARWLRALTAAGQPQIPPLRCASVGMTAVGRRGGGRDDSGELFGSECGSSVVWKGKGRSGWERPLLVSE